jgi:hypothetical protein
MALGLTTIKILRGRVNLLMHENGVLRRENERLKGIIDLAGVKLNDSSPDYGLGGHEFIDPVSGIDTWNGAQGAD